MDAEFTYTYVRIKLRGSFWSGKIDEDYQGVIDEHAKRGWRFVQAFSPAVKGYGASAYVDLIFERRTRPR